MKNKRHHTISNAYEAHWFLYEHPKLMAPERVEISPEEADKLEKESFWIMRDIGGKCYRMYRHLQRRALEENLEIFYTKTDKPDHGRINDDKSKNKYVSCWLEFGSVYYGYAYSGSEKPMADWDTETALLHGHDQRLDCGGPTFDAALVRLARLVKKHYGDYEYDEDAAIEGECGKPVCADCHQRRETAKELGIE